MRIFLTDCAVTHILASCCHPQTNGACERFHATMKNMIRAIVYEFNSDWDECLPWILFAYREIPVVTLGFSPFELLFGRQVRGPISLLKSRWKPPPVAKSKPNVIQYNGYAEKLKACRDCATDNATLAGNNAKTWYDKKARLRTYEPGQLVLVCLRLEVIPWKHGFVALIKYSKE